MPKPRLGPAKVLAGWWNTWTLGQKPVSQMDSDNTRRTEGVASQSVTVGTLGAGTRVVVYSIGESSLACASRRKAQGHRGKSGGAGAALVRYCPLGSPGAVDEGSAQSAGRRCRDKGHDLKQRLAESFVEA